MKKIICMLVVGCFCCPALSVVPPVTIAISSGPANLNPLFSRDGNSQNLGRLTHISLTDFSKDMRFVCRLCQSYQEQLLDGKHVIHFKLRKDIKFWDGSLVTSHDVKKSVEYYSSEAEKLKSIFRFAFQKISDVKVLNKFELKLVYDDYHLSNLSDLSLLKIIKIPQLDKLEKIDIENIIGAGEYKYGTIKPLEIELLPIDKKPKLIFKVVRDETTLALKLVNGEIDITVASISPRKVNWITKNKKDEILAKQTIGTNYNYLGINHKNKYLSDLRVRQALAYLVPRKKIIKYRLKNMAVLSDSMFSKSFGDVYVANDDYVYNPKKAEKLLDEAGYKRNNSGERFTLNWKYSNNKSTNEIVQIIKNSFEQAGVMINDLAMEWGTFYRAMKKGNFDLVISRWVGFTDPGMLEGTFHSKKIPPEGFNRGHYSNYELDKILDHAKDTTDTSKRNLLFKKAIKITQKDLPYINLWHPDIVWLTKSCIKNLELHPNGSFQPLLNLKSKCQ